MYHKALVIVNPGARRAAREAPKVVALLLKFGVHARLCHTKGPGDARQLVASHGAGADVIFSLGGDGTAREVLDAAARVTAPVAILRGGTGNLVARALGVPARMSRAVPALLSGRVHTIDLAECDNGQMFAFAAGVGVDVAMIERAGARMKRVLGTLAYSFAAARAVLPRRPFTLRAIVDGTAHEFTTILAFVANFGSVFGGRLTLGPRVAPNDGLLDLCVYTPRSFLGSVRVLWNMSRAKFGGPDMHFLRGREIVLEALPPRRTQADGELMGMTPVTYRVVPGAVRLLVPNAGERVELTTTAPRVPAVDFADAREVERG